MLKYTTILESKKFKVSKVKNTKTNKSWYSLIYWYGWFPPYPETEQMVNQFGKYKKLSGGCEWKFSDLDNTIKKYNWALLRWG